MQTNNIKGFILRLKEKLDYYGVEQLKKTFDITDEELTEMCNIDKDFKRLMFAKGFTPLEAKGEPVKEEVQEPKVEKKVKTTSKKKASK
jgi:hypothetical protein